jgi:hypothetical protein
MTYSDSDTLNTGTERFRIHTDGNVGIGTATPTDKLSVLGNISAFGLGDGYQYANYILGNGASGILNRNWFISHRQDTLNNLSFVYYNGSDSSYSFPLNITAAGYIGIGTTTPTSALTVSGDINLTGNIYQNGTLFSTGANTSIWTASGGEGQAVIPRMTGLSEPSPFSIIVSSTWDTFSDDTNIWSYFSKIW